MTNKINAIHLSLIGIKTLFFDQMYTVNILILNHYYSFVQNLKSENLKLRNNRFNGEYIHNDKQ